MYHLLLIQGHPLRLVRQGLEQGTGALTGWECDSHCESESPHPGMWEGEWGSKGNPLMYKAAVWSDFALCPILSDVFGPQLYITTWNAVRDSQ